MLEFAIATPWDDTFLAQLTQIQTPASRFAEVFGSHRATLTGTGRPSFRLPDVTRERFEQHVRETRRLGLRFNYVMNAPSVEGLEGDSERSRELSNFLEYLVECGVDRLTIAAPSLLDFVQRRFPQFGLTISLIAGVANVDAARKFEDLGADVINLDPFVVNRDFRMLRAIRAAVRCKLEVYANIACLDHCPWSDDHYHHSADASRKDGPKVAEDEFLRRCSGAFLSRPEELLRSPFVRPEDVHVYRDLGIDILKLADRTQPAAALLATARAYAAERSPGDLFELIFRGGRKFRAAVAASHPEAGSTPVPIAIDNRVLDELRFLDQIAVLEGEELDAFYRAATAAAVRLEDLAVIETWRSWLVPLGGSGR